MKLEVDRRKFLGTSSSALLLASCASLTVTPETVSDIEQGESAFIPEPTLNATLPETSLASIAHAKGVTFGTAIGSSALNDMEYLKIIEAECDVLVAENEHKLYSLLGRPGPYQFDRGDALVLLWNRMEFTPDWVAEKDFGGREGTERFIADYIKTLTEHYVTDIHSWDVVNETINPETGKRGTPIDTFGVQGHLGTRVRNSRYPDPQSKAWQQFIDEIVGMDYKLIISEFDVNDTGLPADIVKRDQEVAAYGKHRTQKRVGLGSLRSSYLVANVVAEKRRNHQTSNILRY